MRISDWSSDVCSSDLGDEGEGDRHHQQSHDQGIAELRAGEEPGAVLQQQREGQREAGGDQPGQGHGRHHADGASMAGDGEGCADAEGARSEEHTSELQSLMRISYAVFCWKKTHQRTKLTQMYTAYAEF